MRKVIILLLLIGFGYELNAQNFNYYQSGLLIDAYNNPYQRAFTDIDGNKKVQFSILPIDIGSRFSGQFGTVFGNIFFGEDINRKFFKGTLEERNSALKNRINIGNILLKVRLSKKHNSELLIANFNVADNSIVFSNNMLRFLTQFNGPFPNASVPDFFTSKGYATAYNKTTLGYRTDLTKKLSIGINGHYYAGVAYAGYDFNSTGLSLSADSSAIQLALKGNAYTSFNPEGTQIDQKIISDIKRNTNMGFGVSIGAQYHLNDKINLTFAYNDIGFIKWNTQSYIYAIDTQLTYQGVNMMDSQWAENYSKDVWNALKVTSENKQFRTGIRTGFDIGFNAKFGKRLATSFVCTYQPYIRNAQFTAISQLRVIKNWWWAFNFGKGFNRNSMVGTAIYLNSKGANFYLGTEQIGAAFLKSSNFGMSANLGFALKF